MLIAFLTLIWVRIFAWHTNVVVLFYPIIILNRQLRGRGKAFRILAMFCPQYFWTHERRECKNEDEEVPSVIWVLMVSIDSCQTICDSFDNLNPHLAHFPVHLVACQSDDAEINYEYYKSFFQIKKYKICFGTVTKHWIHKWQGNICLNRW